MKGLRLDCCVTFHTLPSSAGDDLVVTPDIFRPLVLFILHVAIFLLQGAIFTLQTGALIFRAAILRLEKKHCFNRICCIALQNINGFNLRSLPVVVFSTASRRLRV